MESLDNRIVPKLNKFIGKSTLECSLSTFGDIVYQTFMKTFGAKQHQARTKLQKSRSVICLFVWLVSQRLRQLLGYIADGPHGRACATHGTELGDNDFCLRRSHYTNTDPTSRERRPQRESNPGPPHQELRALPTELPRPPRQREMATLRS